MNGSRRLILFARFPEPGRVKTRLIPALGTKGAAALHRRLVLRALRTAHAACQAGSAELELRFDGADEDAIHHWLGDRWRCRPQAEGDLGDRMARAFEDSFSEGSTATIIIGSDCPALTPDLLVVAFESLGRNPAVLGPATDGGYYLIGLARQIPELFRGISWGTDRVLAESVGILERSGLQARLLHPLDDIDRPGDLPVWRRFVDQEEPSASRISVLIPALNEAENIAATLESVQRGNPHELIVVDGGSTDDTTRLASSSGALVLPSKPGRARQMNAGAARATGNLLLFVHADTILPPNWARVVAETLARPWVVAGAFGFQIAAEFPGRRFLEWGTNWRSRRRQMPYGDQAVFLRQATFEEEGGFANLPIMEDYEFMRRLRRRGRILTVPERAITSGRRWKRLGVVRATVRNKLMIAGYHLGVSPHKLAEFYRNGQ